MKDIPARRAGFRKVLASPETVILPSVYDAISARVVENAGFDIALMSGSVSAASLLGVPDLILVTMTEIAGLAKRLVDATSLAIYVDADHGFGNALNVMRCVQELEAAGIAAMTLEDTDLPKPYGAKGPSAISIKEMCGKLKAAVAAREDPSLVIIGRTDTLRYTNMDDALERARAYQDTGVDAIFLPGAQTREELEMIREAIDLPLINSGLPKAENGKSGLQILQECGFSLALMAAQPARIVVQALHEAVSHLKDNGEFGPYAERMCSKEMFDGLIHSQEYGDYRKRFMEE
ncbi:MAG: isocitrate lyase/phosphoenolpyruvate mutase family protein [SAR324 cluster bacterium]|nr:isocitrate lyase/phosphoenolpyruvate mutase family protein [SAR324 cluster bacterium]